MNSGSSRSGWTLIRPLLIVAAAVALGASSAHAQTHTWAVGLTGGASIHNDLTPGLDIETTFESGWIVGLQAERWLGAGRFGVRFNSLYTQRSLDRTGYFEYNVVSADFDVLARPLRPNRLGIAPYAVLGVGATHYGGVAGTGPIGDGAYGEDPVLRLHVIGGAGVDFAVSRMFGLRLEAVDQVVFPSMGESPTVESGFPNVHNVVVVAGVQVLLGQPRRATPRTVTAPAEPAQPEAQEEPETEPQPEVAEAEEAPVDEPEEAQPEPVVEPEPEPQQPAADVAETLYTAQLDAYMVASTADRWVQRLSQRGIPSWRVDSELGGTPVSVVRAGALPSEADAMELARIIEEAFGRTTRIDTIGPEEPVPAAAVVESLRVLERQ